MKNQILERIKEIKDYTMFTVDMQAGYNLAIDEVTEIVKTEDDINVIRKRVNALFSNVMLTQFAEAGYHQALDRIRVFIDGGTAEDYKHKEERMKRCQDCVCLVRGDYGDWVCDELRKNVITISDECNM